MATTEAGHFPNRVYTDRDGNIHLNGANLYVDESGTVMSTTELGFLDGVTAGTAAASKAVVLDANSDVAGVGKIQFTGAGSGSPAVATGAVIMGVGTTAAPCVSSTADDKFLEFRCESSATSGDNRLFYGRFEMSGIAGGGECIRALSKPTAALGTARGAHISLDFGDSGGTVSGLGVGCDAQLLIGDHAYSSGTVFAGQSQIYMSGASSTLPSSHAIHSINAAGNATGIDAVLNAFAFQGSTGSGKMILNTNSSGGTESNGSIRVLVDEGSGYVARYLRYWDAENS